MCNKTIGERLHTDKPTDGDHVVLVERGVAAIGSLHPLLKHRSASDGGSSSNTAAALSPH